MRALTVAPEKTQSARTEDVPDPPASDGSILARALALGICGTDIDIATGGHGWSPIGGERLILGHESPGRVEAAAGSPVAPGDLVVGIVRQPDDVKVVIDFTLEA